MNRDQCLVCGDARLIEVIDLGMHPFADTFIPSDRLSEPDLCYPLIVDQCEACGQVQSRTYTSAMNRYDGPVSYSYTSANSETSRRHWTEYAKEMINVADLHMGDYIIEIGSNDGFLCRQFIDQGCLTVGVDASTRMAELAGSQGVPTITGLWGTELVKKVVGLLRNRPKLVVANNVLNHANDPVDFVRAVADLLAPDGLFVWEVPDWDRLVTSASFDQIYHEHVTYWTAQSATTLLATAGLSAVDIIPVEYHGGSLRILARHGKRLSTYAHPCHDYSEFRQRVHDRRTRFLRSFYTQLDRDADPVVCVGAAAKANTFLTYYHLDATLVDCVTDASPEKTGKFTPGTRIPILPDNIFAEYERPYAIVTAWNLIEPIRQRLNAINPHITYLDPYGA